MPAGLAVAAGDLEGHDHPVAGLVAANILADCHYLAGDLVTDRERTGVDPEGSHDGIQVAARDSERSHDCIARARSRVGCLLPFDVPRSLPDEVAHEILSDVAKPQLVKCQVSRL